MSDDQTKASISCAFECGYDSCAFECGYDAGFKAGAEVMRERAAKKCEEYSATLSKADCPIGGILKPLWCANEIRAMPVDE